MALTEMVKDPTRRQFFRTTAGGAAWAMLGTGTVSLAERASASAGDGSAMMGPMEGATLLTNPRYTMGAKFRLGQFIKRGADPEQAKAVFSSLPDLAPEPWAAAWTRLAEPWARQGAQAEA